VEQGPIGGSFTLDIGGQPSPGVVTGSEIGSNSDDSNAKQPVRYSNLRGRELWITGGSRVIIVQTSRQLWLVLVGISLVAVSFYLMVQSGRLQKYLFDSAFVGPESVAKDGTQTGKEKENKWLLGDAGLWTCMCAIAVTLELWVVMQVNMAPLPSIEWTLVAPIIEYPAECVIPLLAIGIVPGAISIERFVAAMLLSRPVPLDQKRRELPEQWRQLGRLWQQSISLRA
jgi:hypothetical protein